MSDKPIPASGQKLGEAMMAAREAAQTLDAALMEVGLAIEAAIDDAREADKDFQILGLGDIFEKLHNNSGNHARSLALHKQLDKMRRALGWGKPVQLARGPGGR
jgi:hypothetical protein